ncbi:hypothetical protein [Mucilaginibacter lacusdianchii]|uniref:hypothetical protein n=1 Tax=Mucilaginibacter lacusdianchii TaxID=2684211 RepID=UPI00131B1C1E|nr:hypothetical protein [Mucilaginibacter sp. JXJ CY 39]
MKKLSFLIGTLSCLLFVKNQAKAQTYFAQDLNGSPIREKKYTDVNGSPYLTANWEKATVQLSNGQTYNVEVKYDLVSDDLTFKSPKGDSLSFVQPVKEFKLSYINDNQPQTHLYRSGFPSTGGKTTERSFYEVLYDGGTKLLKKRAKSIWMETTTYGTATQTKNITDRTTYFAFKDNKMIPIKQDKKSVLAALSDKADKMEKYVKENKIDWKQDTDLAKVFEYYNSI